MQKIIWYNLSANKDKNDTLLHITYYYIYYILLQITYFVPFINFVNDIPLQLSRSSVDILDQFTFLGNCPPTPPLNHHFAVREKWVLMLA